MSPVRHPVPITLAILLAAGCSSPENRLVRHIVESNRQQAALKRWMTKLKRAFHTVEKQQQRIARLERQLADLEQGG